MKKENRIKRVQGIEDIKIDQDVKGGQASN